MNCKFKNDNYLKSKIKKLFLSFIKKLIKLIRNLNEKNSKGEIEKVKLKDHSGKVGRCVVSYPS
jgi:hypothetical protein